MKESLEDLKDQLRSKKKNNKINFKEGLSSGCTLLNLALSGRADVGYIPGKYYFIVGDSTSGKTFLALTSFAEATINPIYDNYRLIYDNAEDGALMDIQKFFGSKVVERTEPPFGTREDPHYSTSIDEFYFHVDDAVEKGVPFIYVLDSMDVLDSQDAEKKFQQKKKASRKKKNDSENEEKVAGSYGDGKAKINSANLRRLIPDLRKTNSILAIINQTRDNIGVKAMFGDSKTRSGGHALRFYASWEMWSSVRERTTRLIKGKQREVGIISRVKVKKNRITGRSRTVDVQIFHSVGFSDTDSNIKYLVAEGHWKEVAKKITAPEFDFVGKEEALANKIEEENKEGQLRMLVSEVWADIEKSCCIERKRRYS